MSGCVNYRVRKGLPVCKLGGCCQPAVAGQELKKCTRPGTDGKPAFRARGAQPKPQRAKSAPVKPASLPCVHRSEAPLRRLDSLPMTSECKTCKPVLDRPSQKMVYGCGIHGKCMKDGVPKDTAITYCGDCTDQLSKPMLQVEADSRGLGDNLIAMCVAEGLRQQFRQDTVALATPSWFAPWASLFENIHLPKERLNVPTSYCDLKRVEAVMSKGISRWKCWAQQFGASIKFPKLKELPEAARLQAMSVAGRVVISPFSSHADRTWQYHNWLEVEKRLMALGFRCVIVTSNTEPASGFQSPVFQGKAVAVVTAVIKYSYCLIGNDSGMMHLAGILGVPGIAACSRTSDKDIFGCYPSITQLGGRGSGGLESVKPDDMVKTVLSRLRIISAAKEFPAEDFAETVIEADRWRLADWNMIYSTLWQITRELAPKKVVEIGTRAGQSAWVFRNAAPTCEVHGFDLNAAEHGGFVGACEHAHKVNPDRFKLTLVDSHTMERIPECDLFYVDGDHTYEGALQDMLLGERSDVKTMAVDDVTNCPPVLLAVRRFVDISKHKWRQTYYPSNTGCILLQRI